MHACPRFAAILVSLTVVHCGGGVATVPPSDGAEAAPPAPTESATAAEPQSKTLRGTIEYRKVESGRMSVDAYLGDEILLVDEAGQTSGLLASEAVDRAALEALNGKKVEIQGTWSEGEERAPQGAYPTNPDGSPMRGRAGYRVLSVRPIQ